jgi:hypothetical protein
MSPRERRRALVKRWAWWLDYYLAHWPLYPPLFFCRRTLWAGLSLAIWGLDYLSHPALQLAGLILVPVLLAAWCGDLAWSLRLALVLPWAQLPVFSAKNAPVHVREKGRQSSAGVALPRGEGG